MIVLVLYHIGNHIHEAARLAERDLALAVYDVFLEIVGYLFRRAVIFLSVGDAHAHLLAEAEEVVYRHFGRKDDGVEVWNINFLRAEILRRKTLHFDERTEHYIYSILFRYVKIWRFIGLRLWLGN